VYYEEAEPSSGEAGVDAALDQIEEWTAILAVQVGVGLTAKLLRRIADEVERLPAETLQ
jgi:hypothetical protein